MLNCFFFFSRVTCSSAICLADASACTCMKVLHIHTTHLYNSHLHSLKWSQIFILTFHKGFKRAGHWVNWPAERMILPTWFDQYVRCSWIFLYKLIHSTKISGNFCWKWMDQLGPTGKVSKKSVHLLDHFSWLDRSDRHLKVVFELIQQISGNGFLKITHYTG